MQNIIDNYIQSISSKFRHEETSEMGYRTDFEILLKEIFESIKVRRIDHDARAVKGNKPDFVVIKGAIPILYIETKNIGTSLDKVERSEQMSRYFGYANLILTDYVEFRFFRNGIGYGEPIKIADYDKKSRTLVPHSEQYEYLTKTLLDFTQSHKEPIRSANHLAKIMGGKGQRIRDNIRQFLSIESEKNTSLVLIYESLKKQLVHDLTEHAFADMYAQTLVYGLFTARFFDKSSDTFTRQEARELIPKSNPLLRHFFDHITGSDFDERLEFIVNELCEVFSHANVLELMKEYTQGNLLQEAKIGKDPIIHFYEDFLKEYDPELRKKMGAYYTPLPVVQFIVRSVDEILKKDFGLVNGLADTTKNSDNIHKVQILDPAVGTGTFISKVIGSIYESLGKGQDGRWPAYVQNDLLPRLHGFELMMTPYTIAHLKLSLAFKQTGFMYFNYKRLGIYLTNSLEQNASQEELFSGLGFSNSIAEEAKEASKIKNEKPIMVVIGNPPYSVSSSNKGEWIQNLIKDYKKDLNERNIQPLSDDYIKFIRFAEHFIEKNGSGIVAMITNNSFIDGIIHRQMRKHLLETFDDIYILDLHGNSKKKETTPDGGKDENVFDIQQGVSINIFVRKEGGKKSLGKVYHADLYGKRIHKFEKLNISNLNSIKYQELDYSDPSFLFIPKDDHMLLEYEKLPAINSFFIKHSSGITTSNDKELVSIDPFEQLNIKYSYKPFDTRNLKYNNQIGRPRKGFTENFFKSNIAIVLMRRPVNSVDFSTVLIVQNMVDKNYYGFQSYAFPLFLYSENGTKTSNLTKEIFGEIEKIVGKVLPEDIFDYIYAVLHSPKYRDKYKEFLKIDFPRLPYPKDKSTFTQLVKLGTELRHLHLLESSRVNQFVTTYPIVGSDKVEKIEYKDGNVFINSMQYFGEVPQIAWNFYIGGYQPSQKWLKDRKGRTLTNADIEHYQKMIVSLIETDRIMKKIDEIWIE